MSRRPSHRGRSRSRSRLPVQRRGRTRARYPPHPLSRMRVYPSIDQTFVSCPEFFLMVVARNADGAGDVAVARRKFEARAGGMLADSVAIKLLPRRLIARVGETALRLQIRMALLHFLG